MIDIEKTLAAAEKELNRLRDQSLIFGLEFPKVTALVSVLQLSLRHPDLPEQTREIARKFVDDVIGQAEQKSADLAAFMRLGDDPNYDAARLAGPTGKFPEGKIAPDDQGELKIAISHADGQVVIKFGTSLDWLALPAARATQFAKLILSHAGKV